MIRKKHTVMIALAVTAAIAGTAGLMTASHPAQAQATSHAKSSIAVETIRPTQVNWPLALSVSGPLAAWQEAIVSAETGGLRIIALHADVGTRVTRGQLLAELASDTVKAEVRKAEAAAAAARAELRQAESNVRRGDAVRASGSLSGQQIEQYEITQQTALARLHSAEADLESAKIRLGQTRITAPDDGVISDREATLGTVVASGTKLFTMVRRERVEWRAEVDAGQRAQLRIGQNVEVRLPNGTTANGRIRQLSPTLDAKTRTAVAYVDLPHDSAGRAGAYASGKILLGERAATVLPSSAITMRDGRSYVFEVNTAQQTVIQHQVTTGRVRNDLIEIVDGLKPGVPVVRSGGSFLNDGDTVRIGASKDKA